MKNLETAFKTYSDSQDNENNDSFSQRDNLFIIAEGIGCEYLNNAAKELACKIISDSFFNHLSENQSPGNALVFALEQANRGILEERNKLGEKMAVSVSVVYFTNKIMYFTHLGDSRIYSLYGDEIDQMTRDHTIFEEDPYTNKRSGNPRLMGALTNGLGIHSKPNIEVKKYPIPKKGLIIMTTEGLTRRVSNREILRISLKNKKPGRIMDNLISLAVKKGGNNKGNATVGIIRFGGFPKEIQKVLFIYSLVSLIILILIGSYFLKYDNDEEKVMSPVETAQPETETEIEVITVKTGQFDPGSLHDPEDQAPEKIQLEKTDKKPPEEEKPVHTVDVGLFDRIFSLVNDWKSAWEMSAGSKGDIERYILFYSEEFKAGRFDREAWKQDKILKNRKKKWIRIELSDIRILGPDHNNQIEVRFFQNYRSSNYSSKGGKVLYLSQEAGEWKIVNEKGS